MASRSFFKDRFLWLPAIIGLILMLLTLHVESYPVEGSTVAEDIQGTDLHIFLFISSMPAWITGIAVSSFLSVPFPAMACVMQIVIYGAAGRITGCVIDSFRNEPESFYNHIQRTLQSQRISTAS